MDGLLPIPNPPSQEFLSSEINRTSDKLPYKTLIQCYVQIL